MANLCLIFKTYLKSAVAYIKSLPIKRAVSVSRVETTMLRAKTTTTRTAGIPTRPGSLHPMLVPGTQCYKWTKADVPQFKWKNDHSRAMPMAAKYTLFIFFPIASAQHVMLLLWIGSRNGKVFLFGSGYRSAGGDMVRIKC